MNRHAIVSYPRSGRGLLRTLLTLYHGTGYSSQRAERPGAEEANLILTHDFNWDEEYPDRRIVVMVRHPLASMASWFLQNVNDGAREHTREAFEEAATSGMVTHWKNFVGKWVLGDGPFILTYDKLVERPRDSLREVLQHLDEWHSRTQINRALARCHVERRNDHSAFPYYQDPGFVHELECQLDPELGMLQDMGLLRVERGMVR